MNKKKENQVEYGEKLKDLKELKNRLKKEVNRSISYQLFMKMKEDLFEEQFKFNKYTIIGVLFFTILSFTFIFYFLEFGSILPALFLILFFTLLYWDFYFYLSNRKEILKTINIIEEILISIEEDEDHS